MVSIARWARPGVQATRRGLRGTPLATAPDQLAAVSAAGDAPTGVAQDTRSGVHLLRRRDPGHLGRGLINAAGQLEWS